MNFKVSTCIFEQNRKVVIIPFGSIHKMYKSFPFLRTYSFPSGTATEVLFKVFSKRVSSKLTLTFDEVLGKHQIEEKHMLQS